jgi:hypothetical protein
MALARLPGIFWFYKTPGKGITPTRPVNVNSPLPDKRAV